MKLTYTSDSTRTGLQGYSDIVEDGEEFFYVSNGRSASKFRRDGTTRQRWSNARLCWTDDSRNFWPRTGMIKGPSNIIEIL